MSEVFLKIINMSISASYIVLAVLLLRLLLKRAPKWIAVVLWGIVAVRLVCPFSIESVLSLIPSSEVVSPDIMMDRTPEINTGIPIVNQVVNPIIGSSFTPDPGTSANPLQLWIPTFAVIWIIGMVVLLIYTVISYVKVKSKIGTAVLYKDKIYQSENVISPFVLGLIKPKIYLPFNMDEKDMEHVVAHETAHICRKDHLWKPIGFLLLTLHWFNPIMWLGYVLLCRDIELACDEKVIKGLGHDERADYSQALLTCSVNRRIIAACPLAFGEVGVKDRVKSVLNYKKPAFWIIIAAVIACVAVAVCFLTNPPSDNEKTSVNPSSEIFTEYEGVYVSIKSIDKNAGGHTVFNLIWHNTTDEEITYGESYTIERKEGDDWVNTVVSDESSSFTAIGWLLHPNSTENKSYSTQGFDVSQSGTYRLKVEFFVDDGAGYKEYNTWVEFNVGFDPITDYLREQHPEYFGIDASDGLDVYVWQMAQNSYSFGLLPHSKQGRDWISEELLNLKGVKAEEMSAILSTYNIEKNDIYIIPWQNPLSSYLGGWQIVEEGEDIGDLDAKKQAYIEKIREMLFETTSKQNELTFTWNFPIESNSAENSFIYILDLGCDVKDTTIYFEKARFENGNLIFDILWRNEGSENIVTGPDFEMYKYNGSTLEKLEQKGVWNLNLEMLAGKGMNVDSDSTGVTFIYETGTSYNLSAHYDVLTPGIYRFEAHGAWIEFRIVDYSILSTSYDSETFDIDGDGEEEICSLQHGRTSGLFTFIFLVKDKETNEIEYETVIYSQWYDLSFQKGADGIMRVQGVTQGENPKTHLFDISIKDGYVNLTENGVYIGEIIN